LPQSPKSHWPLPQEPPDFIPHGWVPLFEAYKLVGRHLDPDEWLDGLELAVPSDDEVAANRQAAALMEARATEQRQKVEKAKKASVGITSQPASPHVPATRPRRPTVCRQVRPFPAELVHLINDETARRAARERGDRSWYVLRQWLFARTVRAICIDDLGNCYEIQNGAWASPGANATLLTGQVKMNGRDSYVLVSQSDLEKVICVGAETVTGIADAEAAESNVHTPPFLDFMIRAANELGLEANTKVSKKSVEEWLRNNWPEDLGRVSNRKIETMATLLRQPKDQKGGFYRSRRGN